LACILFSEGSSLTAREFLSVLGPAGHRIEIVDPDPACICRFSRWTRRVHRVPAATVDPLGYLEAVRQLLATGRFDALLPTHEQAWLFAAGRSRLGPNAPLAVASAEAFARVQSKIEFARLLDALGLPQPRWQVVRAPADLAGWAAPYYLKAAFSTAGAGVRKVGDASGAVAAWESLRASAGGGPWMVQAAADGDYAQVQALFDHGRLVAVHTSAMTAVGIGPSAAGRVGVDHAFARRDVARLGGRLRWHGGLTLDYMFRGAERVYLECNPRTVEPANAAASGVDLPRIQVALSRGEAPRGRVVGRPGVRTHGSLAVLLGTAAYAGTRRAVARELVRLAWHRGPYERSREGLTPVFGDPPSLIPLGLVAARALLAPRSAVRLATRAVARYTVHADTIRCVALADDPLREEAVPA
jgi:hypothetical protein